MSTDSYGHETCLQIIVDKASLDYLRHERWAWHRFSISFVHECIQSSMLQHEITVVIYEVFVSACCIS